MFYIYDPDRFKTKSAKGGMTLMSLIVGPLAASMFITMEKLRDYIESQNITDPKVLVAHIHYSPEKGQFLTEKEASQILKWLSVSKNPKEWAKLLKKEKPNLPIPTQQQSTGGGILRDDVMTLKYLEDWGLVNTKDPNGTFAEGSLTYEAIQVFETFFFWVRELEPIFPELDILITALNSFAPMVVTFISDNVAGLLSPLGVFPFSAILFKVLGQMAAYPYIAYVVYVNISRGDLETALIMSALFMPFIGPMTSTALKTGEKMVEKVEERWDELINIPQRIMTPFEKTYSAFSKVASRLFGASQTAISGKLPNISNLKVNEFLAPMQQKLASLPTNPAAIQEQLAARGFDTKSIQDRAHAAVGKAALGALTGQLKSKLKGSSRKTKRIRVQLRKTETKHTK